jgi:hypothetical protein
MEAPSLIWNDPCDHLALDAEVGELPVEGVARRPRLVANLELAAISELVDELSHRFRRVRELAQTLQRLPFRGHRRGDRLAVYTEAKVSGYSSS